MKKLSWLCTILILGASLGFAQTNDRSTTADNNQANAPAATRNSDTGNDHSNWGWIGLLGLAGLAGLGGRKREREVRDISAGREGRRVA
jgi:LPXTG-motif cell wall-anchored protein